MWHGTWNHNYHNIWLLFKQKFLFLSEYSYKTVILMAQIQRGSLMWQYQMETAQHPLKCSYSYRLYCTSLQETFFCYKHTNMYDNKPINSTVWWWQSIRLGKWLKIALFKLQGPWVFELKLLPRGPLCSYNRQLTINYE